MTEIPDRIPSEILDRIVAFLGSICDLMIILELRFNERLDDERLARACDLTLDAEPVLGCRFVADRRKPYWERLEKNERQSFFLAGNEDEHQSFRTGSAGSLVGPQLKSCLWHASDGDRLILKVAHEAADAGGTKEIAKVFSSIYRRLADEPDYRPSPNLEGSRSHKQVMRLIPWYAYPRIYFNYLRETWNAICPAVTHTIPVEDGPREPMLFVRRQLPVELVTHLANYGRERNATLNDMMLAAFYRAIAKVGDWDGEAMLRLMTTVDLRRYLPTRLGEAICNMSSIETLSIGNELGDNFLETLTRVNALTLRNKAAWIGLNACVALMPIVSLAPFAWMYEKFERLAMFARQRKNAAHALTNMGPIREDFVHFDAYPREAWILPPPGYPTTLLSGLSGYAGTLTLSAGTYPTQRAVTENLFDTILDELPG